MYNRLEPGFMTVSRKCPGSENIGDSSPFMTVYIARSVVRKLWLAVLFFLLAVVLFILIVSMLIDINQSPAMSRDQLEMMQKQEDFSPTKQKQERFLLMQKEQARFNVIISTVLVAIFLIFGIYFLVSAIQNYRGSYKDFSELMAYYRLSKKNKDNGDIIACPKCGDETQTIGRISS